MQGGMKMNEIILRVLRQQAWERAKGELEAVLASYNSNEILGDKERFSKMYSTINSFVSEVEDNGYVE